MFVSIYYKPSLFNAHTMILIVHIFMNVNKLGLIFLFVCHGIFIVVFSSDFIVLWYCQVLIVLWAVVCFRHSCCGHCVVGVGVLQVLVLWALVCFRYSCCGHCVVGIGVLQVLL